MKSCIAITGLLLGFLVVVGCSGEQQAKVAMRRACLSKIGLAYHAYFAQEKHCPASLDELTAFMESTQADDEVAMEAVKRMRERDIIVFCDETLTDPAVLNDKYVLAFEPSCMGAGGYIVTGGGVVDHVTGKKFVVMEYLPTRENLSQK